MINSNSKKQLICGFLLFYLSIFSSLHSEDDSLYGQIASKIESDYYDSKRLNSVKFIKAFSGTLSYELTLFTITVKVDKLFIQYKNKKIKEIKIKDTSVQGTLAICSAISKCIQANGSQEEKEIFSIAKFKALYRALKTMDPHSAIYDPLLSKKYAMRLSSFKFGIGLDFIEDDDEIIVQNVYEKSAAETAGIKEGDTIVAINEEPLLGLSVKAAHGLIKKSGSYVKIVILKKGTDVIEAFELPKDYVKSSNVDAFLLNDEIGYFKIKRFSVGCFQQFQEELAKLKSGKGKSVYWEEGQWKIEKLKRKAGIQSFIIDLRNNSGGLFKEAIKFCDYFLPKGKTIVTEKSGKRNQSHLSKTKGNLKHPLIILVNEKSASSSEIFAGCLQNYNRALVIGRKTYGKGSVQQVEPILLLSKEDNLRKPLLKLTMAEYFVAANIPIQTRGVRPNIKLIAAEIKKKNIRLSNPRARREVDRHRSIESKVTIKQLRKIQFDELKFLKSDKSVDPKFPQFNFYIRLAIKLLEGDGPFEGNEWKNDEFYTRKKSICQSFNDEQLLQIKKEFSMLGITWNAGGDFSKNIKPSLKVLNFEKSISISITNKSLLKVNLKNVSRYAANKVSAKITFKSHKLRSQFLYWGRIDKGKSKEISAMFSLGSEYAGCRIPYQLTIESEHHKHQVLEGVLMIEKPPRLKFSFQYKMQPLPKKPGEDQQVKFLIEIKKESLSVDSSKNTFTLKTLLKEDAEDISFDLSVHKDEAFLKNDKFGLAYVLTFSEIMLKKKIPLVFSIKDRGKRYEIRQRLELDLMTVPKVKSVDWSNIIYPIEIKIDGEQKAGGLVLPETYLITGSAICSNKITEVFLTRKKRKYCHQFYPVASAKKKLMINFKLPLNAPMGSYMINIKTSAGTTYLRPIFFSRL